MKTKKILFPALIAMMLTSCVSTYFQVYKTVPSDKLVVKNNLLVYEDENCKVSYNLWSEGGNIGFQFFNKTDKNIYLNLEESFFILNGVSKNYYRNRVFTSFSVSYNEEKILYIPSKTSKIISEYNINESLFRDCDLFKYPTKKQIKSKTFSKEQSPLVFSNRIAYSIGQTDNLIKFENEFYVTEISNYPESEMFESKYDEYCGQKSLTMTKYFKNVSADRFYIKYSKGKATWKH